MKIGIYEETKEKEITLRLFAVSGVIDVYCVDENGDRLESGYLLSFGGSGTVYRIADVDPNLGFDLDSEGRIKTVPETLR